MVGFCEFLLSFFCTHEFSMTPLLKIEKKNEHLKDKCFIYTHILILKNLETMERSEKRNTNQP